MSPLPTLTALLAATLLSLPTPALTQSLNNESVLGVYMFHRHGDRTAKILAPTNLTDLGYREVYTSGSYYRSRYLTTGAPYRISGISADVVNLQQVQASAPIDNVLQNSATGFLQGLYPPVGAGLDSEVLGNGSSVTAPMSGYQLIPVAIVESGDGSEDSSWLQSSSGCFKAEISSNEYFSTPQYNALYQSTMPLYKRILPVIDGVFDSSSANYFNAYLIWDYINVSEIHNQTIPDSDLLTTETLGDLTGLAAIQQWNLAYNASDPIRAIAGKTLGAQVVQFFESTIADADSDTGLKFGVQFGAYGSFSSFFGLAGLTELDGDWKGITNYASSMVFEMFTNASTTVTTADFPSEDEIYVRFLYRNGTATDATPPVQYPLFGTGQMELKWTDFMGYMNDFSIGETGQWCQACGNTTGICEGYGSSSSGGSSSGSSVDGSCSGEGNGLSPAVNGVIGAMVTLAVVLGLEALVMLLLGLTVVKKKNLAGTGAAVGNGEGKA